MNSSLTISITNKTPQSAEFWVHVEQVKEPEIATLPETAELVDKLFELNPCEEDTQDQEAQEPVTEEEFPDKVKEAFDLSLCYTDTSNSYETFVIVTRSNNLEDYNLRLTNGNIGVTKIVTENRVDHVTVKDQLSVTLDFLPLDGVEWSWGNSSTGNPEVTVDKNVLSWEGNVTGSLTLKYTTTYDKVAITVFGNEDGLGECTAIVFYHGITDSVELAPPQSAVDYMDEWDKFCKDHGEIVTEGDRYVPESWETRIATYRCQCSNEISHVQTDNEANEWNIEVSGLLYAARKAKDNGNFDKSNELTQQAQDLATAHKVPLQEYVFPGIIKETFGGYVDCGETTGDINTVEFYTENCCDPPKFPLPNCSEVYRQNTGGKELNKDKLTSLKAEYGDRLKVVSVSPVDGNCGTTTTKQKLIPKNCCDGVSAIAIDTDSTPDVLPAGNHITVYWTGGRAPFTATTSAAHTSVGGSTKTVVTSSAYTDLLSTSDFCGATQITVTDGCSTATMMIRSSEGVWVLLPETDCQLAGVDATVTDYSGRIGVGIYGNRKSVEYVDTVEILDTAGWACMDAFPDDSGNAYGCYKPPPSCTDTYISLMDSFMADTYPESNVDTCMRFNVADVKYLHGGVDLGIGYHGGLIRQSDLSVIVNCTFDSGYWSTTSHRIMWLAPVTDRILNYKWSCA